MILFLSLYIAAVCLVPIFWRLARGKLDLFEPLIPAALAMISLFSIRPLAMLATDELDYYRWVYIGDAIEPALLICAVGVTAYVIGYMVPLRVGNSRFKYQVGVYNKSRFRVICAVYIATAVLLLWNYMSLGFIESLSIIAKGQSESFDEAITVHTAYLYAAPILMACSAILIILVTGNRKLTVRTSMIVLVLIMLTATWFSLTGARRFIIPSIFIPLLTFLFIRKIRPKLKLIMIGLPLFFVLSAVPYMRHEESRNQIGGIEDQVMYAFTAHNTLQKIYLGGDTEMLPVFAVEVKALDSPNKFYYGAATLGDLFIAPIPSALIKKPMSARNRLLVDTFGYPCKEGPARICPDFSVIGTFYQDFWIPGVLLGMALMGMLSRRVWERFVRDPNNPFLIFNTAVVSVFTLIIIRAGFMPAFQWLLYFWIPVTMGLFMIVRRGVRLRTGETE